MTATYTKQQIALALATLGIHSEVAVPQTRATALARARVLALSRGVSQADSKPDIGAFSLDPVTGYSYDPLDAGDCKQVRTLTVLYRLFKALHPEVPLWTYEEREERKRRAWERVRDTEAPLAERLSAAHEAILTHYARSACASLSVNDPLSFVRHPGVDDYTGHYLHSSPKWARDAFGTDVFAVLALRHAAPERLCIEPGRTVWGAEFAYVRGVHDE